MDKQRAAECKRENAKQKFSNCTVEELKIFLDELRLSVTGTKSELVDRLVRANTMAGREPSYTPSSSLGDETNTKEIKTQFTLEVPQHVPVPIQRDINMQYQQLQQNVRASPNTTDGRIVAIAAAEIRAISGLLCEFRGYNTFWRWEKEVQHLRTTYALNDASAKILISSELRGKAYSWFHSTPSI